MLRSNIAKFVRTAVIHKRILSALLLISLSFGVFAYCDSFTIHASDAISLSASSAVLIDADSGKVLYEKNANEKRGQASTTKIMTAIIALERSNNGDVVKVSPKAVGIEGSSVYLQSGEALTMEELVYALMLESANDAAAAIAYEIAGGIPEFSVLMNEKAAELGLSNTHFTNPHGLSDEEHYTTALDLALLTSYAMQNDVFCNIVSTQKKYICTESQTPRLLINHNKLLRIYDGAIGVKTGFTKNSGRCLVSAAEKDGLRLIAVTLNAPDDWNDHRAMLDYGFSKYTCATLAESGDIRFTVPVVGGEHSCAIFTNPHAAKAVIKEGEELSYKVELPRFVFGGFSQGDVFGRVVWYRSDGTIAAEAPLAASFDVERTVYRSFFMRIWESLFSRG